MKKILAMLLMLSMVIAMTACGTGNKKDPSNKQVTLRFASWSLGTPEQNNLERQMIAAFEKAYPNIKIEIAEDIVDPWNDSLNTAASGKNLPDVALIAELPTAVANQWALDLSTLAANDPEWKNVPESLVESGKYNGKLYGIPTAMNLAGFFVNTDYFEEANVDSLEYGYKWEDFEDAVKKLHKPTEGKAALRFVNDFVNFLPYIWDNNQGWYTYDGEKMTLNSKEFIKAVNTTKDFVNYAWVGLSEDQMAGIPNDYEAWRAGKTAIWYDGTWGCEGYKNDLPYEVEFVGLADGKSVIIPDYCFIASTTEHPQEAWEFVKFMFWGKQGINTRMDLDEADDGVSWSTLPLNMDEAIIERYFKNFPIKGVEEAFRGLNTNGSVVEAFKFAPGYSNARWNGMTGITVGDAELSMGAVIDKCIAGELSINDYAEQLNTLANRFINEAKAAIDNATK